MSHVVKVKVKIRNLDALRSAASKLGLEMTEKSTYRWYGTHVGDYPLPEGFSKEDLGKCQFAISVPGKPNAYEIGVVKDPASPGEYTLLWDFWSRGYGLQDVVGDDARKLTDAYTLEAARITATEQGWYSEYTSVDGVEHLVIYHPSGGTLTVSPRGTVDADGFIGAGCAEATGLLGGSLGITVDESIKAAFYSQQQHLNLNQE